MHETKSLVERLAEYIKINLKKGYTLDSLKFSLINQGYTRISVENAIHLANARLADELPKIKEKPEITYKLIDHSGNNEVMNFAPKKSFWQRLFG